MRYREAQLIDGGEGSEAFGELFYPDGELALDDHCHAILHPILRPVASQIRQ
jgi:hypothetical protein